jgi:hypothetical protein
MDRNRPPGPRDSGSGERNHGIALQHAKLEALCDRLRERLAVEDSEDCLMLASQLRLALDSHFSVEENVLFPALLAKHPELREEIASLEGEHKSVRRQLDQLLFCVGATSHAQAASVLSHLRALLDGHEQREERCLAAEPEAPPR